MLTSYADFEQSARDALAERLGIELYKDEIDINGKEKSFDIVNRDERIVGDVKNYKTTSGGNRPSAKFSVMNEYCWLMQLVERYSPGRWRKMLVVGEDKPMLEQYKKEYDACLDDIEIYFFSYANGIKRIR